MTDSIHRDLKSFYNHANEKERLSTAYGLLELERTKHILQRHLLKSPAIILDIGGAAGQYSFWLASLGYEMHLIDPVPLHVKQAKALFKKHTDHPIASITLGDARQLMFKDNFADAILLMGPLYHLQDKKERKIVLDESYRVLKYGGTLFAVGISRFASTIDGLFEGYSHDPDFQMIMIKDLETGLHHNPTQNPLYFTDTYFHHPDELKRAVKNAGFSQPSLFAIEGFGYMVKDFQVNWDNKQYREFLLWILEKTEQESTLIGASPHMMCIAKKLEK